jgi:membrane protein required for colicin V production
MNALDYFLIIPIVIGFIWGVFNGLIKELTSLVAIVLGIYGAKICAPFVAHFLMTNLKFTKVIAFPFAYILLFIAISLSMNLLAKIISSILSTIALGGVNKFLGGVFGGLKIALIISILLNLFNAIDRQFSILKAETKSKSIAYKPLIKMAPELWDETKKRNTKESKLNEKEDNTEN